MFKALRDAIELGKRVRELSESLREAQNVVADLGSEVKRLRMEWADHLDYTERAVGRWAKREQVDRKKARESEEAAEPTGDIDQLIRDGRASSAPYRPAG